MIFFGLCHSKKNSATIDVKLIEVVVVKIFVSFLFLVLRKNSKGSLGFGSFTCSFEIDFENCVFFSQITEVVKLSSVSQSVSQLVYLTRV